MDAELSKHLRMYDQPVNMHVINMLKSSDNNNIAI